MKLHPENVARFQHRRIGKRVSAGGGRRLQLPAHSSCGRNRRTGGPADLAAARPAEAQVRSNPCAARGRCGKRRTVPLKIPRPDVRRFFARSNRPAGRDRFRGTARLPGCVRSKRLPNLHLVERPHHLAEMPDSRQHDLRGALSPAASRTSSYLLRFRPACSRPNVDCPRRNPRSRS